MKEKRIRMLEWLRWTLLAAAIILCCVGPIQAAGEIGKLVDKKNVKEYKDLLPPALYKAVEIGDYILQTANLPFHYRLHKEFLESSEKNAGKFDVDSEGRLIDKATRKWPQYNVYGFPFPSIDPKDPNVAVKIMWNFKFMKYRVMGYFNKGTVYWVDGQRGADRIYHTDNGFRLYYQGREPGKELKSPKGFLYQYVFCFTAPMSVKGMNSMVWEYQDDRDNAVFAYVPVIRRIRQSSGASRSDTTMGGDSWNDLAEGWDGKNQTMKWKLVGERTILVPFTKITKDVAKEDPDGTLYRVVPPIKYGFNTPGWKGAPWAPTNCFWVPRKVWIIEQMPKDPYYNWGLHVNYIDQETYVIWHKEVWNKAGEFRVWQEITRHLSEGSSGRNDVGEMDSMIVVDQKVRHATIADSVTGSTGKDYMLFMPQSRLDQGTFSLSNFLNMSK